MCSGLPDTLRINALLQSPIGRGSSLCDVYLAGEVRSPSEVSTATQNRVLSHPQAHSAEHGERS